MKTIRTATTISTLGVIAMLTAGCASAAGTTTETTPDGVAHAVAELRLGYFANVTHAPAVIGEEQGLFAEALGDGVKIEYSYFNAGTEAIEALFAGSIDALVHRPNPAINGFVQSDGEALRIVAGRCDPGGASLVVKPGITGPEDLADKTLATPSLGNTQDVALRAWLADRASRPTDGRR